MKEKLILTAKILISGAALLALIVYGYSLKEKPFSPNQSNNNVQTETPADLEENETNTKPGKTENLTGLPLSVPQGFSATVFARNVSGARVIIADGDGNFWLSRTSAGRVTKLTVQADGSIKSDDIFRNLRNPHGIALDPDDKNILYIAEEHRITKALLNSDAPLEKVADLPTSGGGHFTRTLKFGLDKKLYVSIGSSCNVCLEADERRAAIYRMDKDGANFELFARGLRNSVFFAWSPFEGKMWATENGRDNLGDNIPPDEINIVEQGKNYGWPICYGKNNHDDNFDKNTYIRNPCMDPFETGSHIDLQAHSAALGLTFIPATNSWPKELQNDLLVAFHGSWNRSEPTGYKVVRVKLDEDGNSQGIEDFVTGFRSGNSVLARPVDVFATDGGDLFITDDRAGAVYKLHYNK